MAKQTGKSGFMSKVGDALRKAHEAHAADETTYSGFGDLPPGINNAVAQLVDCKFTEIKEGKENAGEYMFYAAGVVVIPKEFEGVPVQGLRTQISEPMFATPLTKSGEARKRATVDDHVAWVYNELRKLGLDTSTIKFDNLEMAVAALKEAGPYFRFRTWASDPTPQYPNPRTNHQWEGALPDFVPPDDGDDVQDNSGPAEPPKIPPKKPAAPARVPQAPNAPVPTQPARQGLHPVAPATTTPRKARQKAPEPQPEPQPDEEGQTFDEFGDLDTLAKQATAGSAESTSELSRIALSVGMTEDEVNEAVRWSDVVERINELRAEGAGGGDWKPETTDVYLYTAKGKKEGVQVQVTAVDEAARTVNLKTLAEPKVLFKGVDWDSLETA